MSLASVHPANAPKAPPQEGARGLGTLRYSQRALALVWHANRPLAVALFGLSVVAGVLPGALAWVGKLLVDAVILASTTAGADTRAAFVLVAAEMGLVLLLSLVQRTQGVCSSLLRARLGNRVNEMILEKALTLDLSHFENPELYDKLTRARREASSRPLALVMRAFGLVQHGISLTTYALLLAAFSGWAVLLVVAAALPAFFAETKFSGEAFRLFRWRTPETREQAYLETLLAREDYAKEVKLFGLGRRLLDRYHEIFDRLYESDRKLTLRRGVWGFFLGALGSVALYGAYAWIVADAVRGLVTIGAMTMYVVVFKQAQGALSAALAAVGGIYEDNLYLSNLYELLEEEVEPDTGATTAGAMPGDGLRFENVSFRYPGANRDAVSDVTFHLLPGQKLALVGENGSGKTTLIKLLARLYRPTSGRVMLDGTDLRDWSQTALARRVGVIFQDFVHYQFSVGENIGAGDEPALLDRDRWKIAADLGMATPFVEKLPQAFDTQLGRWFKDGQELSLGQWQKIALARAFMRQSADVLVLDEPTASMDAEAEAQIFTHFRENTQNQMAIVISHRFSTVRMADYILVLADGRVIERGSHDELVAKRGRYATLFELQAAGYR